MRVSVDDILADDKLPAFMSEDKSTVPFPQANSVDCILKLLLNTEIDGSTLSSYIVRNVVNSSRQAQYYAAAAVYLGLCRRIGDLYYPTSDGIRLQRGAEDKRNGMMAAYILAHPVVGRWFTRVFVHETNRERLSFIQTGFDSQLAAETARRRSQCVLSWIAWVRENLPVL